MTNEDNIRTLANNVSMKIALGLSLRISRGEEPEQAFNTEVEDTAARMLTQQIPLTIIEEFREQYRLHSKKLINEAVLAHEKARTEKEQRPRKTRSARVKEPSA